MTPSDRFKIIAGLLRNALLLLSGAALLMLPGALRLGKTRSTAQDGMVTVDDAIAACRDTGLSGWALVTFAQQLVWRKFAVYTIRNLWASPAQAFEHGRGYCTQYNLALKQILEGLGFETRVVFCLKVKVLDEARWTMGHTWLRVTINGEERDVCAGRLENIPGHNSFMAQAPVWPAPMPVLLLTHLGVILLCGLFEWKTALTGRPVPYWGDIER